MKTKRWQARAAILVAAWVCVGTAAVGQQQAPSTAARSVAASQRNVAAKDGRAEIAAHAAEWLKENDVPSVAVAYIEDGKVAWTAVYGEQSPGVAANEKTLYNMASLTKPITAETILRLASAGKISLDESMAPYWVDPDIKDEPWTKLLTPRICLTHQTGFANWRRMTGGVLKMQWEPGTQYGYSGEGYNYVGRFAEAKLGKPFDELAQETVFDPMGMKDTSYTRKEWYAGRLAVPQGPKGEKPIDTVPTKWNGADLLRTTIGDYAKFVTVVMHDEALTKQLNEERETISRDQVKPDDAAKLCKEAGVEGKCTAQGGMGLGWEVDLLNGEKFLNHGGSDWGVKTYVMFSPAKKMGIVVFTNGENGNAVIRKVVEALYPNPLLVATI